MSRLLVVELKEFDPSTLSGSPKNFGSALLNPAIKISIFNTGTTDVYLNCTNTPVPLRIRIPANGTITLDESTLYFRGVDQEYYLPRGAQLTLTQVTAPSAINFAIIAHVVTRKYP